MTLANEITPGMKTMKSQDLVRVQSIDLLRGIIMIIMAIDHVRVYSGMPAGGPTAGIFFTRWITHFCAPGFAFFAGTSAFLYLMKSESAGELRKFLVTRGLVLVVLELTVIRFSWMFNFDYGSFAFTGVIWMLGWCMVMLAAFVSLRPVMITTIGLLMIAGQQVFYLMPNEISYVWQIFYPVNAPGQAGILSANSGLSEFLGLKVFYVLIPWIGVMMAGFGFGQVLLMEPAKRDKACWRIGLIVTGLFVAIGSVVAIQNASGTPFIFNLLNQQKYPPSQLYIMMTLGPLIALIPWAQKVKGWFADAVIMIGRVPMFYYLAHIPLIHLTAFVVNLMLFGAIHQDWYETAPFVTVPVEQQWGLVLLYLVWLIDVVILYMICSWYANYKRSNPGKAWLKYF